MTATLADAGMQAVAAPPPEEPLAPCRRPLLTPRRSNILLLLLGAILLPTLTYRAMPLLPSTYPLALAVAASVAVGALSLNLLVGYAGQISLGHGALLGVGSFAAGLVTSGATLPMWVALPVAAAVSGLVALVVGFPALRLRGLYLAIVTVTFGYAMYNFVLQWTGFTGGSAGVVVLRRLWGNVTIPSQADMLSAALVVLMLVWLLDSNVTRTKLGRAFRAIRESEAVAGSFGVDVARYKLLAFVLSGALAGVAGALFGFTAYLVNSETFSPAVGIDYSLLLLIVVVVGGLGSRAGAVIAAFVFALFEFLIGDRFGTTSWEYGLVPISGSLLLMATVARHPDGFAGMLRARRGRLPTRPTAPCPRCRACRDPRRCRARSSSSTAACRCWRYRTSACASADWSLSTERRCASTGARSWASSDPTAPARRRCSTASPDCSVPTPARCAWADATSPR
jgi:branched-chain amino acid transport system permease protein